MRNQPRPPATRSDSTCPVAVLSCRVNNRPPFPRDLGLHSFALRPQRIDLLRQLNQPAPSTPPPHSSTFPPASPFASTGTGFWSTSPPIPKAAADWQHASASAPRCRRLHLRVEEGHDRRREREGVLWRRNVSALSWFFSAMRAFRSLTRLSPHQNNLNAKRKAHQLIQDIKAHLHFALPLGSALRRKFFLPLQQLALRLHCLVLRLRFLELLPQR